MIGLIGAMSIEVEALKASLTDKTEEVISGITYTRGTLYDREVVVAQSGVGKVFAAICAQTMILRYGVELLINTGVAGSLTPSLSVCDIAVSTACIQHDMDTSPLGDPVAMISGINLIELPADPDLVAKTVNAIESLGIPHREGVIVSGDRFIALREDKQVLADTFSGIACDMESAAIAQVCYVNRTPFLALRAISDCADGEASLSFAEFCALAAQRSLSVIRQLLKTSL